MEVPLGYGKYATDAVGYLPYLWGIYRTCGVSAVSVGYLPYLWGIYRTCGVSALPVGYSPWGICRICGISALPVGYLPYLWGIYRTCGVSTEPVGVSTVSVGCLPYLWGICRICGVSAVPVGYLPYLWGICRTCGVFTVGYLPYLWGIHRGVSAVPVGYSPYLRRVHPGEGHRRREEVGRPLRVARVHARARHDVVVHRAAVLVHRQKLEVAHVCRGQKQSCQKPTSLSVTLSQEKTQHLYIDTLA